MLHHARHLAMAAWSLHPIGAIEIPVPLIPHFSVVLEHGAAHFGERAQPLRFASPYPELRGAIVLTIRIPLPIF